MPATHLLSKLRHTLRLVLCLVCGCVCVGGCGRVVVFVHFSQLVIAGQQSALPIFCLGVSISLVVFGMILFIEFLPLSVCVFFFSLL